MSPIRTRMLGPWLACAALFGTLWSTEFADACSCLPPLAPKDALAKASAVLLAKVVRIADGATAAEPRTVTLQVERWWKGGDAATLTVSTAQNGAICGYGFQAGGRYLVYAHAEENGAPPWVSLCSRTRTAEQAKLSGDFQELGEGKAPVAKP